MCFPIPLCGSAVFERRSVHQCTVRYERQTFLCARARCLSEIVAAMIKCAVVLNIISSANDNDDWFQRVSSLQLLVS